MKLKPFKNFSFHLVFLALFCFFASMFVYAKEQQKQDNLLQIKSKCNCECLNTTVNKKQTYPESELDTTIYY